MMTLIRMMDNAASDLVQHCLPIHREWEAMLIRIKHFSFI